MYIRTYTHISYIRGQNKRLCNLIRIFPNTTLCVSIITIICTFLTDKLYICYVLNKLRSFVNMEPELRSFCNVNFPVCNYVVNYSTEKYTRRANNSLIFVERISFLKSNFDVNYPTIFTCLFVTHFFNKFIDINPTKLV